MHCMHAHTHTHTHIYTVIEFDAETGGYYPVLYLNTYWNLAQEYMPLNDTTK